MGDGSGGAFVGGGRYPSCPFVGDYQATGAHRFGAARNGAQVAGISYVVPHHDERPPVVGFGVIVGRI